MNDHAIPARTLWLERAILLALASAYLLLWQAGLPNGDGRVYIRQIDAGTFVWNPNHLYTQPIGLLGVGVLRMVWPGLSTFAALKLLAGASAVLTLLIVHACTAAAPLRPAALRIVVTISVCFSAHFLSMAIAEEYYMIQMPVLAFAFLAALHWARTPPGAAPPRGALVAMGVLGAVATGIAINNGPLIIALGMLVAFSERTWPERWRALAWLWCPALAVGLPLFVLPYLDDPPASSFVQWLVNYQGTTNNPADDLYGLKLSPKGVAISLITLGFGSVSSVMSLRQLGAVGESILLARPLEFQPNWVGVGATVLLLVFVVALFGGVVVALLRTRPWSRLVRLALAWIAAYLFFNFLWVDTSDQFYFQLLPALWILVGVTFVGVTFVDSVPAAATRRRTILLGGVAVLLAVANTLAVVSPRSGADDAPKRAAFAALLQPGDLLITPGWDDVLFLGIDPARDQSRILLMEEALAADRADDSLRQLRARVATHLASGRRVLVARLFDLDSEGRPWEDLDRRRWGRRRLQALLAPYEDRVLGRVGDVVIRELRPSSAAPSVGDGSVRR